MGVICRTGFYDDGDSVSLETGLVCNEQSLTVQSEAEDADINVIVRRFGITGELPTDVRLPLSGDFTQVSDFQSAMNAVNAAQAAFMEFPAEVRARFGHDPANLIAFAEDPANRDEAIQLGLALPVVDAGAAKDASTATPSPSA